MSVFLFIFIISSSGEGGGGQLAIETSDTCAPGNSYNWQENFALVIGNNEQNV